jgi:hypothetical protein
MKTAPFVPHNFEVPAALETERFRLRMLSAEDVEKGYQAVIESRELLHSMGSTWPREGFTIQENLAIFSGLFLWARVSNIKPFV